MRSWTKGGSSLEDLFGIIEGGILALSHCKQYSDRNKWEWCGISKRASPPITRTSHLQIQPPGAGAASSHSTILCFGCRRDNIFVKFCLLEIDTSIIYSWLRIHIFQCFPTVCLQSILFITFCGLTSRRPRKSPFSCKPLSSQASRTLTYCAGKSPFSPAYTPKYHSSFMSSTSWSSAPFGNSNSPFPPSPFSG